MQITHSIKSFLPRLRLFIHSHLSYFEAICIGKEVKANTKGNFYEFSNICSVSCIERDYRICARTSFKKKKLNFQKYFYPTH